MKKEATLKIKSRSSTHSFKNTSPDSKVSFPVPRVALISHQGPHGRRCRRGGMAKTLFSRTRKGFVRRNRASFLISQNLTAHEPALAAGACRKSVLFSSSGNNEAKGHSPAGNNKPHFRFVKHYCILCRVVLDPFHMFCPKP